jgi:hypothetical protein
VAAVRKWLHTLALIVGLGLTLVVGLGVEDARQAAWLDAREEEAADRFVRALSRQNWLDHHGAPAEEVRPADLEVGQASRDFKVLWAEQERRNNSWHARLFREVRRRTGWRAAPPSPLWSLTSRPPWS